MHYILHTVRYKYMHNLFNRKSRINIVYKICMCVYTLITCWKILSKSVSISISINKSFIFGSEIGQLQLKFCTKSFGRKRSICLLTLNVCTINIQSVCVYSVYIIWLYVVIQK